MIQAPWPPSGVFLSDGAFPTVRGSECKIQPLQAEVRSDLNEHHLSRKSKFTYISHTFTESLPIGAGNTEAGGAAGPGRSGRAQVLPRCGVCGDRSTWGRMSGVRLHESLAPRGGRGCRRTWVVSEKQQQEPRQGHSARGAMARGRNNRSRARQRGEAGGEGQARLLREQEDRPGVHADGLLRAFTTGAVPSDLQYPMRTVLFDRSFLCQVTHLVSHTLRGNAASNSGPEI